MANRPAMLVAPVCVGLTVAVSVASGAAEAVVVTRVERVSVDTNPSQGSDFGAVPTLSRDGRFVTFASNSSTLVPGDTNAVSDIFLWDNIARITTMVSVNSAEIIANGPSSAAAISSDGRYITFQSAATNLVPGDTNNTSDVFLRDIVSGTTSLVSTDSAELAANDGSSFPAISSDGRTITFASRATNLVAGDTNNTWDVFARDIAAGTTTRVSVGTGGPQASVGPCPGSVTGPPTLECGSYSSAPSGDGRYVAFTSYSATLVTGDTNNVADVFLRDTVSGVTTRASVGPSGAQGNVASCSFYAGGQCGSDNPAISDDGRYVAFQSVSTNLVAGFTSSGLGSWHVFIRDVVSATTSLISSNPAGTRGNNVCDPDGLCGASQHPTISGDGRYIAFESDSNDLVPADTNFRRDIFVRDRQTGVTSRVSVGPTGGEANGNSLTARVSGDGRHVAFLSSASNLVPGDTNALPDVFQVDIEPETIPGPPSGVIATIEGNVLTVSWSAPAMVGGSLITSYTATAQPGGVSCSVTTPGRSCAIVGLAAGTAYSITVIAVNSFGSGPTSPPVTATPPLQVLPSRDKGVAAVMAALDAATPHMAVAVSNSTQGTFSVPDCPTSTSPLPGSELDYLAMLGGSPYVSISGASVAALNNTCRPGAVTTFRR